MRVARSRSRGVTPRAAVALLAASLLASCDHAPLGLERDLGAFLQTDLLAYDFERETVESPLGPVDLFGFSLEYEFTNRSDRLIHVLKCKAINFRLERREGDGTWTPVWEGPSGSCFTSPIPVSPGQVLAGTVRVEGLRPDSPYFDTIRGDDTRLQFRFETDRLTGYFRLAFAAIVYAEAPGQERTSLEVERRISNAFRLRAR